MVRKYISVIYPAILMIQLSTFIYQFAIYKKTKYSLTGDSPMSQINIGMVLMLNRPTAYNLNVHKVYSCDESEHWGGHFKLINLSNIMKHDILGFSEYTYYQMVCSCEFE